MKLIKRKAQSIVELMLVMGLMTILLPVLAYGFISTRNGKAQQIQHIKATALLKEVEEGLRTIRESGWNNFPSNGTYFIQPKTNEPTWELVTGTAEINGLTETIELRSVYRNSSGNIVSQGSEGAVVDPSTKAFDITISWLNPISTSLKSTLYLVRLDNVSEIFTDHGDFDPGTITGTEVVNTNDTSIPNDAQIQLGAGGGGGDWCQPSKSITEVDLPKNGAANAIYAIEGSVFAGTGDNASGISFGKVGLTVDEDPPTAELDATFDGYKTNGVFGEENFAYITTDTNSKEVVIIDLNQYSQDPPNGKYLEKGAINLPGNLDGQSVFVVNDRAFVTSSNNKLFIYDLTDRSNPIRLNSESGFSLSGLGKKIMVTGNYAYIATSSTTYQLDIVNISDANNPVIAGRLNTDTGQAGVDVYVNSAITEPNRAYLVTNYVAGLDNFYVIDISNPNNPSLNGLGRYNTSGMSPTGVTVVTANRAIVVGTGGTDQYQVINLETMNRCAQLQYPVGIKGVSSVLQTNGYAYSYILTTDQSKELKIILGGGSGTGNFTPIGTYTSTVFDAGYNTAFNRFFTTSYIPSSSTVLEMQIAVSNTDTDCNNENFTYIGPDPDNPTGTRFILNNGDTSGIIPYKNVEPSYVNPGRYFCYRLYFNTTDNNQTPILHDLSINYSP